MTLPRVLFVLVLANTLGGVLSCGGGGGGPPPPCSWQTCRHEWRNDWGPGISTGHCVNQHRNAHHVYDTHQGSGTCPASSSCSPSTQYRTMCKYDSGSVPLEHGVDVINKSSKNIETFQTKLLRSTNMTPGNIQRSIFVITTSSPNNSETKLIKGYKHHLVSNEP